MKLRSHRAVNVTRCQLSIPETHWRTLPSAGICRRYFRAIDKTGCRSDPWEDNATFQLLLVAICWQFTLEHCQESLLTGHNSQCALLSHGMRWCRRGTASLRDSSSTRVTWLRRWYIFIVTGFWLVDNSEEEMKFSDLRFFNGNKKAKLSSAFTATRIQIS